MQAEFEALIQAGATRISLVDFYMGGRTARDLRDQVFLPLARRHPGVSFEVHWVRELMGFERQSAAGGVIANPRSGDATGRPGGAQLRSTEATVRMALGDDMQIVFDPQSREPITIFDAQGRVVQVFQPRAGQTTRQLLIELLTRRPAGP